jgi:hypothetical protein
MRAKHVVVDTSSAELDKLELLTQKSRKLQQDKLLLELEKQRMDLIIHVTEANNLHSEVWKESLDQTNNNYDQAIQMHRESLQNLHKEIRNLKNLKSSYKSVTNQSRIEHENYIQGMHRMKDEQGQASDMFFNSEQMIDETSVLARQELQDIDKNSLEHSLAKLREAKKLEEEEKQEALRLALLKSKSEYLAQQIGISAFEKEANSRIVNISEKILRHKDAKEKAEALKIYRESLELTLNSLKRQRELLSDQRFEEESPKITLSALGDLKNKAEGYDHLLQTQGCFVLPS